MTELNGRKRLGFHSPFGKGTRTPCPYSLGKQANIPSTHSLGDRGLAPCVAMTTYCRRSSYAHFTEAAAEAPLHYSVSGAGTECCPWPCCPRGRCLLPRDSCCPFPSFLLNNMNNTRRWVFSPFCSLCPPRG